MLRVHELFDLKWEDPESSNLIDRAFVTQYTSLMVQHFHEDKKEPSKAQADDENAQSCVAESGRLGTTRHLEEELVPQLQLSRHSDVETAKMCACPSTVNQQILRVSSAVRPTIKITQAGKKRRCRRTVLCPMRRTVWYLRAL